MSNKYSVIEVGFKCFAVVTIAIIAAQNGLSFNSPLVEMILYRWLITIK